MSENNYLSASEYAAIVGLSLSIGEIDTIESTAAKICAFGGIATLETFDHTRSPITAYPVTILAALCDLYLTAAIPSPVE